MIKNKQQKIQSIVSTINPQISKINEVYRTGPDLYFYTRIIKLRKGSASITSFLDNQYCLEMLYATLVSWDMNSRGAKMKYFNEFKESLMACKNEFKILDSIGHKPNVHSFPFKHLRQTYAKLDLMKTNGKLVSNSKLLHFLFPYLLMPMDRKNTLAYFYGNTGESINKYVELTAVGLEMLTQRNNWDQFLDDKWNQTPPKLIDNAVILLMKQHITASRYSTT